MKDILDREIPDGSLVIGMIVSRDSDGMRFGVFKDNQCVWRKYGLMKSKPRNVYLVENPSEKEFEIKQEILEGLRKKELELEQLKNKRKAFKRIPTKQLIIGGYYEDDKENKWLYFGKAKVITTVTDSWGNVVEGETKEEYGYCYACSWDLPEITRVTVLKSPKKLVDSWEPEDSERISMSNLKFTSPDYRWRYRGNCKQVIEIILEDSHD